MKKFAFTPEFKTQMAGVLPFSSKYVHEFTPKTYKDFPEGAIPVFKMKPYTNEAYLKIKEGMQEAYRQFTDQQMCECGKPIGPKPQSIKDIDKKNKMHMKLLYETIVGWDDLYDIEGDEIEWGSFENFMNIKESALTELFTESMRISGLC